MQPNIHTSTKERRSFSMVCLSKQMIAPSVYELRFQKPDALSFVPGQFVLFDVPLVENAHDIQPRAYSIASTPAEKDVLFVIKLVPHGRASRWVESVLEKGTTVHVQGPFGAFTVRETPPDIPNIFVATGTGIAPIRSQILTALQRQENTRQMHMLFGALRPEDLFWMEEWHSLEKDYPNFHAHVSCLSGEPDWHGQSGSLQQRVPALLRQMPSSHVYICGAPGVVKELKTLCLDMGMQKSSVHIESYI